MNLKRIGVIFIHWLWIFAFVFHQELMGEVFVSIALAPSIVWISILAGNDWNIKKMFR